MPKHLNLDQLTKISNRLTEITEQQQELIEQILNNLELFNKLEPCHERDKVREHLLHSFGKKENLDKLYKDKLLQAAELVDGLQDDQIGVKLMQFYGVDKIFENFLAYYSLTLEDLVSSNRTRDLADIRHISIHLLYHADVGAFKSFRILGKMFSRDRTTLYNSLKVVAKLVDTDKEFTIKFNHIKSLVDFSKFTL